MLFSFSEEEMTQPPVGQPQPPNGQLPQPGGPGDDYPPALPPVTPVKRVNAYAVAGIVLGILFFPLGLLFSIIGLVKSKARAGSGKVLSIVGIVVSLAGAATFIGYAVEVSHLLTGDPGCIAAENDSTAMMNTFSADIDAIIHNEGTSAERAAVQHFIGHAQALRSELTVAAAKAQRQPVRAEIGIMINDLDTMTSGLQAVLHGDTSQISPVIIASTAMTKESTSLLSLCPASVLLSRAIADQVPAESRSTRRRILPAADLGIASITSSCRICL